DEASGTLRLRFHTAVEPYGGIEGHHLIDQQMNEFIMKDCSVLFSGEIAALTAPRSDCRGHAADQLPNTGLAFGSPSFAVEILGSDDVCSGHRPAFRHFYVLLFKYDFTRFIPNRGSPVFPFDRVVGRHALPREVAPEFKPLFARCPAPISIGFSLEDFLFHVVLLPYIVLFETDCARYRGVGTDQVQEPGALKRHKIREFLCLFVAALIDEAFFDRVPG